MPDDLAWSQSTVTAPMKTIWIGCLPSGCLAGIRLACLTTAQTQIRRMLIIWRRTWSPDSLRDRAHPWSSAMRALEPWQGTPRQLPPMTTPPGGPPPSHVVSPGLPGGRRVEGLLSGTPESQQAARLSPLLSLSLGQTSMQDSTAQTPDHGQRGNAGGTLSPPTQRAWEAQTSDQQNNIGVHYRTILRRRYGLAGGSWNLAGGKGPDMEAARHRQPHC